MIQLNPTDLFAIRVPADALNYFINNAGCIRYDHNRGRENSAILPEQLGFYAEPDNCEILGFIDHDSCDFDLTTIIQWLEKPTTNGRQLYKNYLNDNEDCTNLVCSYRSLLAVNGLYFENPMGKEFNPNAYNGAGGTFNGKIYTMNEASNKWKELQNGIIKGKLLIIRKRGHA